MATIPQRELRNDISAVLRRAEGGERITVTVNGRPVAELSPAGRGRRPARGSALAEVLEETPVDPGWAEDLGWLRDEERAVGQRARAS